MCIRHIVSNVIVKETRINIVSFVNCYTHTFGSMFSFFFLAAKCQIRNRNQAQPTMAKPETFRNLEDRQREREREKLKIGKKVPVNVDDKEY